MKRDARIGLAVVLVLGLGVTLLVGRALYKHGGSAADDGDYVAGENNLDSGKVDAAATTRAATSDSLGIPTTAATNQPGLSLLNPDAQKLLDDQSKQIERGPVVAGPATPPKHETGLEDDRAPTTGAGHKSEWCTRNITRIRLRPAIIRGRFRTRFSAMENSVRKFSTPTTWARKN